MYGHVTRFVQSDAFVATHVATCTVAHFGIVYTHAHPIMCVWEE